MLNVYHELTCLAIMYIGICTYTYVSFHNLLCADRSYLYILKVRLYSYILISEILTQKV